jgi:uncharacterized oligopeptide transporter (OPT) family protein
VAWIYPLLRTTYGIGEHGLSSPTAVRWAGFAEVLSGDINRLPKSALIALGIASLLGVVLAVLEMKVKDNRWIPSPAGMAIGMLIPAAVVVSIVIGAIIGAIWTRRSPRTSELYQIPLASGLIAGEALVAVIVPLLVLCGLVKV